MGSNDKVVRASPRESKEYVRGSRPSAMGSFPSLQRTSKTFSVRASDRQTSSSGTKARLKSFYPRMSIFSTTTTSTLTSGSIGQPSTATIIRLDSLREESQRRSSFLPEGWEGGGDDLAQRDTTKFGFQGGTAYRLNTRHLEKEVLKKFCTGSRYIEEFHGLGMARKGIYKFPHGVIYDGYFNRNGEFHGAGTLIYPGGQRVEGWWTEGKMAKGANFISSNKALLHGNTCKMPDRRFQIEVKDDLMPAALENLTRDIRPQEIPPGCYDIGMGYYDPRRGTITNYDESTTPQETEDHREKLYKALLEKTDSSEAILKNLRTAWASKSAGIDWVPPSDLALWIKENCRTEWDEPIEYRTDLYETWMAGYKSDKGSQGENKKDCDDSDMETRSVIKRLSKGNNLLCCKSETVFSFIQTRRARSAKKKLHKSRMVKCQDD